MPILFGCRLITITTMVRTFIRVCLLQTMAKPTQNDDGGKKLTPNDREGETGLISLLDNDKSERGSGQGDHCISFPSLYT